MTFRINQINVDLRRNLSKEVKDNEVHRKKKLTIDNKMKKPFVKKSNDENKEEQKGKKKYFTINGVIEESEEMTVEAERPSEILGQASTGLFIDKRK